VLPDPEPDRKKALVETAALSDAVVVMSRKSIDFLDEHYGVPRQKVHLIHHGVPDMPFAEAGEYKRRWGLDGKTVLLTFGLLHTRKGIEYMIEAMPAIVERFPEAVYVVLGATHPPLKLKEGDKYRFSLKRRARELGVEENVLFYDRFVSLEELTSFIAACDIYVTPYLDLNQIVSGTLAYAIGLGKPVISTPYFYAVELLEGGRGLLVPPKEPAAIAEAAIDLLDHPARMLEMRERAYVAEEKRDQRAIGEHRSERGRAGRPSLPLRPASQSKREKRNAHASAEQRRQLVYLPTHQHGGDHLRRDHQGDAGADFDDRAEGKESSQCNEGRFAHGRRPED